MDCPPPLWFLKNIITHTHTHTSVYIEIAVTKDGNRPACTMNPTPFPSNHHQPHPHNVYNYCLTTSTHNCRLSLHRRLGGCTLVNPVNNTVNTPSHHTQITRAGGTQELDLGGCCPTSLQGEKTEVKKKHWGNLSEKNPKKNQLNN